MIVMQVAAGEPRIATCGLWSLCHNNRCVVGGCVQQPRRLGNPDGVRGVVGAATAGKPDVEPERCNDKVRSSVRGLKHKTGSVVVRSRDRVRVVNCTNPWWNSRQG